MRAAIIGIIVAAFVIPTGLTVGWVRSAADRLHTAETAPNPSEAAAVAIASAADESYCTTQLKLVLRRVLKSCGLLESGELRGCQPADAKQVATLAGGDFNALFLPMAGRAGVVEFDQNSAALDASDAALVDKLFSDQQGASYFFVVARASPEGSVDHNRELSKQRAQAVMQYLREKYQDPDLDHEVGLLWLGEEFAQLDQRFCEWQRSGTAEDCKRESLNRSAFISWIDCQL
jgi:outer membrane protein OmpA-like peptidoglycan-associated protein